MPRPAPPPAKPARRSGGFRHAARLVEDRIRAAGESRGFAAARLLTRWDDIVGPEIARLARPVRLGWGRGKRAQGLGATLTLAVPGPAAPMVQMMGPRIVERVNAALGFAAVARIALAQGAEDQGPSGPRAARFECDPARPGTGHPEPAFAAGMAEAGAAYSPDPAPGLAAPDAALAQRAAAAVDGVGDDTLRAALEGLARSVLSRHDRPKGSP